MAYRTDTHLGGNMNRPTKITFSRIILVVVLIIALFVLSLIPDAQEKRKFFRILDYYELNLLFNSQGLCTSVEYCRPNDPNWPYKYGGFFPLENTYTESKVLLLKSSDHYPVHIYRRESFATDDAIICYAEITFPQN